MSKVCNYFVTLRCDDACEFCDIWRNEEYQKIEEKPFELSALKREGVKKICVTGGEPLLREDLPQILRRAKELGFYVELTTNGIQYCERAKSMAGLVDRLFFSLDYPIAPEHDRSRGNECFNLAVQGIKLAQELKERPVINFTMTRDSIRFLPEMVELSEKLGAPLNLNPVYDFAGTQGFEPMTLEHIKYYGRRKNVLLNLAAVEFVRAGGNQLLFPRCRAKETTVTILPDGRMVSPCFYNQGGKQGKEPICSSCMRWPYMLPSFSIGIDKYFWLNFLSEQAIRRKTA